MSFTLISPRIGIQKGDFLGSGIPYWPVELATFASFLRNLGHNVTLIDMFGSDPMSLEERQDYYLQGRPPELAIPKDSITEDSKIFIYAMSYMSHQDILSTVRYIRSISSKVFIGILENSQAVTAYSLSHVGGSFFQAGATALLCGEPYWNWDQIIAFIDGLGDKPENILTPEHSDPKTVKRQFNKTPSFPVPAWDLFNLKNYWRLPYSHGPKTKKFLPIITSRGCPYPCDFCVVPETNQKLWRGRAADEVVNEIIHLRDQFGVFDFQIEDLNPTVKGKRTEEICSRLIERNAGVRFYIVSGTKAETVRLESVPLLAKAGCRYISISPESGSRSVMKTIGKPFDYEHGKDLVRACRENGIRTQACFIVGHPSETDADHKLSVEYLRTLIRNGLDEVAVFVVSPFAGSDLFESQGIHMSTADAFLSFSPKGRTGWETLERRRQELIRVFFIEKLKLGPDLWAQGLRALFGTPSTKMENLPKRVLFVYGLLLRHHLKRIFGGNQQLKTPSPLPVS